MDIVESAEIRTKSSAKKSVWTQCEVCAIKLSKKDTNLHSKDCPPDKNDPKYPYIASATLYSKVAIIKLTDIKKAVGLSSNDCCNIVFLSKDLMEMCGLSIGEIVIIDILNSDSAIIAKRAWPLFTASCQNSVYVSENGTGKGTLEENQWVSLQKPMKTIQEAERVTLKILNKRRNSRLNEKELIKRIKKLDHVLTVGNVISLLYFGRIIKMEVMSISNIEDIESELHDQFAEIGLGSSFSKTGKETVWSFSNEETNGGQVSPLLSKIGGCSEEIRKLKHVIKAYMANESKGNGILLHGPSGTGKTMLVKAVVKELNVHIVELKHSDIYRDSKSAGEYIDGIFEEATDHSPSVIIIDNIEQICPPRNSKSSEIIQRTSSILLDNLDALKFNNSVVFIIAITNNLDDISASFTTFGRFHITLEIPAPDKNTRQQILSKLLEDIPHELDESAVKDLSSNTHGFVGGDLAKLCAEASLNASLRSSPKVTINDFKCARNIVGPSALRGYEIEVPDVKWEDIGGQEELKATLKSAVDWPEKLRLYATPPKGVLMFGPPGCSKTTIAKALARESGLNFISVKGPELLNKYVGESERAIREIFKKARQVAPAVLFFDEFDALAGDRSSGSGSGSSNSVRDSIVAQLLAELDGFQSLENVIILAATNRPDRIDRGLLRPGRFDKTVYVPLPDNETRRQILQICLKKLITMDIELNDLVRATEGYSGAELKALCNEAAIIALKNNPDNLLVTQLHFQKALESVRPSTSFDLIKIYNEFNKKN